MVAEWSWIPSCVRIVRRTIILARKTIRRFGVATVADLAATISEATSSTASAEFVTSVLEGRHELSGWTGKTGGSGFAHSLRIVS